ncbi:non-ATPase subunit 9 [Prunus dulcis]|uniref:Non-ATPase subunit 9 n=1 Tax=Prunus dulcis TaxID=3755 RepID=A0A5H2XK68_PRUDU|nr:non-ATPase subunit 9 [Prunus dulcis]
MTRSTVRVSHRLPLVFFVVSELKDRSSSSCFLLSVKMVSQHQSKDSGSKKNEGKELGMVAPQDKSSKKMKFASSSAETEPTSQTTISDDSKTGRGMSTMPRVVKRKLQKLRPIVEYNKRGKSYIGVLARSRVPLVDKKWSQIPKDIKEQIWEAVDMAFVVGQGGKNSVLSSAAKKWKDFKLSKDFESVHSQHAQIREKLEYNHRLSRKGYAGLEDQLEETMPGVEIDRSTLWKRARQDKHGNIPDPKVAEKAKLIMNCKKVSEGKVSVYGSNDVLTMALGPEASRQSERSKDDMQKWEHQEDEERRKKKKMREEEEKQEEKEKEDEEKHDDKVIEVAVIGLADVRAKRETVYFLDPLPGHRVVDEEAKNIVNSTPKQPSNVECGYYVMRFMRDIIMDPSLAFENKYAKGNQEASYPQEAIDEVRNEWAEFGNY